MRSTRTLNLNYTPAMLDGSLFRRHTIERRPKGWVSGYVLFAAMVLNCLVHFQVIAAESKNDSLASDAVEDPAYRKLIKEGLSEYDARHFDEARSLFQRAHELNPNARTFRGIGMASFELRDYVSAVHNLSAALKDNRKPLSNEQRRHVQDLLDRSRMFVDVYSIVVTPKNARVLIDGRLPEFDAEGIVVLGFGQHVLEASLQGYIMRTIPINVRGGERKELIVTLERVGAAASSSQSQSTQAGQIGSSADDAHSSKTGLFDGPATPYYLAAGASLVVGLGAGAVLLRSLSALDECNHRPTSLSSDYTCSNRDELKTYRNLSLGGAVVGAAAAGTFIVLGIMKARESEVESHAQSLVSCVPTGLGLSCGGRF